MPFSPDLQSRTCGVGSSARVRCATIVCLPVVTLLPQLAWAQESQPGDAVGVLSLAAPIVQRAEGFLFRTPMASLVLRGGFNFARAGSDLFDLATDQLTLEKSDFGAYVIGADIGINVTERIDVVANFAHMSTSKSSEYWEFDFGDDEPITQQTRFAQMPVTLGARYYLMPRGRQIGQFVWIPATVAPYVGVSAGVTRWEWEQSGSWVDYNPENCDDPDPEALCVFDDTFESDGWAPIGQGVAGFDYTLGTRVILNTEARYTFGSGELGTDFDPEFDPLDLSGLQLTMGLKFRF